jgi:hypothetical protein
MPQRGAPSQAQQIKTVFVNSSGSAAVDGQFFGGLIELVQHARNPRPLIAQQLGPAQFKVEPDPCEIVPPTATI